jgi:hypothetical protein
MPEPDVLKNIELILERLDGKFNTADVVNGHMEADIDENKSSILALMAGIESIRRDITDIRLVLASKEGVSIATESTDKKYYWMIATIIGLIGTLAGWLK